MPDERLHTSALPYVQPEEDEVAAAPPGRWGWLETFVIVQLLWGVLLFVPGSQAVRFYIRAFP